MLMVLWVVWIRRKRKEGELRKRRDEDEQLLKTDSFADFKKQAHQGQTDLVQLFMQASISSPSEPCMYVEQIGLAVKALRSFGTQNAHHDKDHLRSRVQLMAKLGNDRWRLVVDNIQELGARV